MRIYPTKDCTFYSEKLNAWDKEYNPRPEWKNHVDHPEMYYPEIETRIPAPPPAKPKIEKPKVVILDRRGCPVPPVIIEPPIKIRKKPEEEIFIKVIYYFRDLEGAKKKRIEDKDLYFDYPKKIPPSPKHPPREMSLSLIDYREKVRKEALLAKMARLARLMARKNAMTPSC